MNEILVRSVELGTRLAEKLCLVDFHVRTQFSARPYPTLVRTLDGAAGTHFPFPGKVRGKRLLLLFFYFNQEKGDSGLGAFPTLSPTRTLKSKGAWERRRSSSSNLFRDAPERFSLIPTSSPFAIIQPGGTKLLARETQL